MNDMLAAVTLTFAPTLLTWLLLIPIIIVVTGLIYVARKMFPEYSVMDWIRHFAVALCIFLVVFYGTTVLLAGINAPYILVIIARFTALIIAGFKYPMFPNKREDNTTISHKCITLQGVKE